MKGLMELPKLIFYSNYRTLQYVHNDETMSNGCDRLFDHWKSRPRWCIKPISTVKENQIGSAFRGGVWQHAKVFFRNNKEIMLLQYFCAGAFSSSARLLDKRWSLHRVRSRTIGVCHPFPCVERHEFEHRELLGIFACFPRHKDNIQNNHGNKISKASLAEGLVWIF